MTPEEAKEYEGKEVKISTRNKPVLRYRGIILSVGQDSLWINDRFEGKLNISLSNIGLFVPINNSGEHHA